MESLIQKTEIVPIIDVATSMEAAGYYTDAPRVTDVASDETRTTVSSQKESACYLDTYLETTDVSGFTEVGGLNNLLCVLDLLAETLPTDELEQIKYFKENLTFIGEREFDAAAKGLAGYIFIFASEHPDKKICLPIDWNRTQKSENLVTQRVIEEITILAQTEMPPDFLVDYDTAVELPTEKVQFFLLDDWSVSGHDMSGRLTRLKKASHGVNGHQNGVDENFTNAEVLLMAVRDDQLDEYVTFDNHPVKCKGYFRAPKPYRGIYSGPVPTGSHSSVDYGFQESIKLMAKDAVEKGSLSTKLDVSGTPLFIKRKHRNW